MILLIISYIQDLVRFGFYGYMFKALLEHGFSQTGFRNPLSVVISYILVLCMVQLSASDSHRKCIHKRAPLNCHFMTFACMSTGCMIIPLLQQHITGALDNVNCMLLCVNIHNIIYADLDTETAFKSPYYSSVFHKNTFLIIIYIECDIVSRLIVGCEILLDPGFGSGIVDCEILLDPGFGSGIVGCEILLDPGFGSGIVGCEILLDPGFGSGIVGCEILLDPGFVSGIVGCEILLDQAIWFWDCGL